MKAYPASILSATLIALAINTHAFADTYGGSLLKNSGSTVRYTISCFDDGNNGVPASVYLEVKGITKTAPFLVTATIEKNGATDSVTDKINGDRKASSAKLFAQGEGGYNLTISKAKKKSNQPDSKLKGTMVFTGTAHCLAASGAHTGTDIKRR